MDQYMAIRGVRALLREAIQAAEDPETVRRLRKIDDRLAVFHVCGIDFKEVVECLDNSVLITDAEGIVLYINPAYTRNTGITEQDVLGQDIHDLVGPGKLITGGAVLSVIEHKKSAYRLSTTYKTGAPLVGYVFGTPIFGEDGALSQVVACSMPIVSLSSLREDFEAFLKEVNRLRAGPVHQGTGRPICGMLDRYDSLAPIRTLIDRVAATDATILITGESGVGKEVIADEVVRRSARKDRPYVKLNCASIPGHLLESELFGYERGSFTGASSKGKLGLFECANGGTLMLDEIGDMPMDLQVKLLRAIQSQEITRLGGTRPIKLDIRFLALTNADLKKKVAEGSFRQDLYFRLNVIPLRVPPLRERLEDLEELCRYFTDRFTEKYNHPFRLTPEQLAYMKRYAWPGNIRELENVMEYMVLVSSGIGYIEDDVLKGLLNIAEEARAAARPLPGPPPDAPVPPEELEQGVDFAQAVADFEKRLLEQAIRSSANLREAGRKLNLNASTVSRKIKQYGIDYWHRRT